MRTILVRGSKDCPEGVGSFPTFALDTLTHFWYNQDRRIMRHKNTDEGKIAIKIAKIVDSATLDLDQVGIELARLAPKTYYNRLMIIAEAAAEEQEQISVRNSHYPLF
jgi:hypothetical protein